MFVIGIVVAISTADLADTMTFIRLLDEIRLVTPLSSMCRTRGNRKTPMWLSSISERPGNPRSHQQRRRIICCWTYRWPLRYHVVSGATGPAVAIVYMCLVFWKAQHCGVEKGVEIGSAALDFCANR